MVFVKIDIEVSGGEKKDGLYPADGNKFKTWAPFYQEDRNPDVYSYDKHKFYVIVYIG
jgi:hypothetical protein